MRLYISYKIINSTFSYKIINFTFSYKIINSFSKLKNYQTYYLFYLICIKLFCID